LYPAQVPVCDLGSHPERYSVVCFVTACALITAESWRLGGAERLVAK
jgi:hypothetical protein